MLPHRCRQVVRGLIRQLLAGIHLAEHQPTPGGRDVSGGAPAFCHRRVRSPPWKWRSYSGARAGAAPAGGKSVRRCAPPRRAPLPGAQRAPTSCARTSRRSCRQASQSRGCYTPPDASLVPGNILNSSCTKLAVGASAGSSRTWVILFSDIRGFTTISEQLGPAQLNHVPERLPGPHDPACWTWLVAWSISLSADAVMAVFSLPTPQPDDAERAVQAALTMRDELERFNRGLPADAPPLAIGLGLHHGAVLAGLIGSPAEALDIPSLVTRSTRLHVWRA